MYWLEESFIVRLLLASELVHETLCSVLYLIEHATARPREMDTQRVGPGLLEWCDGKHRFGKSAGPEPPARERFRLPAKGAEPAGAFCPRISK